MAIERKRSDDIVINDDSLKVVVDENSMLLLVDDGIVTPETTDEAASSSESSETDDNDYGQTQSDIYSTSASFQQQHRRVELHSCSLRALGVTGLTTLVPLFNTLALHFASPSILMCFGSGLSLVFTVLFSKRTIGEQPSKQQVFGACLIVMGVFSVAMFGDHINVPEMDTFDVMQTYSNPYFVAYSFCFAIWVTFLLVEINWGSPRWCRSAWGAIGGSLTGGTSNFIKDAMALGSSNSISDYFTHYMVLCGLLLGAGLFSLSSLIFSIQCMKRYDVAFSCASYTGAMMFSVSVMSAVHYNTFNHLGGWLSYVFYPIGILSTLSGCLILSLEPVQSGTDILDTHTNRKSNQVYDSIRKIDKEIITL
eukprot:CAMPEP_0178895420 /NCGR_PEP_ID=MMETSP0786-20121207/578_1 /TAXON_ID=186022 /ORGANISM="Thalassionema frauenfeldii, Strain CCMP 1798" /LENGTH=365 /DNA_ID=CAMNT_0020565651 /DNA_START=173 /DNA_END=1270 /DNA_ORIENTATION=-